MYNFRIMLKRLVLEDWLIGLLIILIVAVLGMSRYAEHRKTENQEYTQAISPSAKVSPPDADKGTEITNKPKNPPSWVDTFTWPDGVVAWALLMTLIVIALQSWGISRQNRNMVAKERARIAVDFPPTSLDLDDGPEWTEAMNAVYAATQITIANLGSTNAFNVTAQADIIGTPDGGKLGIREVTVLGLPSVLKPDASISVDVVTLLKGVNHVATISEGAELIHLIGTITYDDIFGKSRETSFRYLWEVNSMSVEEKRIDLSRWKRSAVGNRAT